MATFTPADLTLATVVALRILGIDPGTQVVGYGCLELRVASPPGASADAPLAMRASNVVRSAGGGDLAVVEFGVLRLGKSGTSLAQRLRRLAEELELLLQRLQPQQLALEEAFYGKSVSAALRIGEARGVILCTAARAELQVQQFAPARVKRSVAGHGAASKEMVARMVAQQVPMPREAAGLQAVLPADATDALAVALACAEQLRSPLLRASQQ